MSSSSSFEPNAGVSASTRSHPRPEPLLQTRPTPHEGHPTQAPARARTRQKPEVMRLLTVGALLCGPGLPVLLFFEMDGVLISSRFFRVNIFRVPFPSIPTCLSLTHRPPAHPRTRHLCAPPLALRGSSVASGPTGRPGSCLSVFLLPRSHIEPRRLTDTQTRGPPQAARAHAVSSAQSAPPHLPWGRRWRWRWGGKRRRGKEGGSAYLRLEVREFSRGFCCSDNSTGTSTNEQTLAALTSALISAPRRTCVSNEHVHVRLTPSTRGGTGAPLVHR